MQQHLYDTIIVGGGPAGLSAAMHLAWHSRDVLVLDRHTGPLFYTLTPLENVPGMPGKSGVEIQRELKRQAEAMGAKVMTANVVAAAGEFGHFTVRTERGEELHAKTLLLATGVARFHPTVRGDFEPCFAFAGKGNLYYCPDCEAPEINGKPTLIIGVGKSRGAYGTARHLYEHSQRLSLLLTGEDDLKESDLVWLEERRIQVYRGEIAELVGRKGHLEKLILADGSEVAAEAYFVAGPKHPRTDLARQLGLSLTPTGHIEPKSQRGDTNVEGVWIAGDVRPMTQQVSIALGTGNIAAVMIDQYLTAKFPTMP